jgi:hypothetical protein
MRGGACVVFGRCVCACAVSGSKPSVLNGRFVFLCECAVIGSHATDLCHIWNTWLCTGCAIHTHTHTYICIRFVSVHLSANSRSQDYAHSHSVTQTHNPHTTFSTS